MRPRDDSYLLYKKRPLALSLRAFSKILRWWYLYRIGRCVVFLAGRRDECKEGVKEVGFQIVIHVSLVQTTPRASMVWADGLSRAAELYRHTHTHRVTIPAMCRLHARPRFPNTYIFPNSYILQPVLVVRACCD